MLESTKYLRQGLTLLLVLMMSTALLAQNGAHGSVEWLTDFDQARELAESEDKTILMSFNGSDWCGNCMRLERVLYEDASFQEFASENLVLLMLDFPAKKKNQLPAEQKAHNEALAERYNPKGLFPTVLFFDAEGNKVGQMANANSAEVYLKDIKGIVGQ